jgi:L-asparaginase II
MTEFVIHSYRSGVVESRHRVSVAVSDAEGHLVARAGEPHLVTFMRSAAKPFQALPLVQDGAVDRFAITDQELALACASHNSERHQVEMVRAWLERMGCSERDLACGPHAALAKDYGLLEVENGDRDLAPPSRLASNCSGKHAGMLALARQHGWDTPGYHRPEHPVQRRVKGELSRWCRVDESAIGEGTDGCGVLTFALPLAAMARGVAALVSSADSAPRAIVDAMTSHPDLVAGRGRLCTALMRAYPDRLVAKVGAAGVYVGGLREQGLGVALKVEDGNGKAAMVALVAALDQLGVDPPVSTRLPQAAELPIHNTRGEAVGVMCADGGLTFL